MDQRYNCSKCGKDIQSGANPCPHCMCSVAWTQDGPILYLPPDGAPHAPSSSNQQQEYDWRKSKAHLFLLSKFIHANRFEDFAQHNYWKNWWNNVLGEPSKQAIQRFLDEEMLIMANDLNDLLSYRYRINELKDMLRQRCLPLYGHKDEMIQRLVQTDPDEMNKAVAELSPLKLYSAWS
jgi:hypothetical protein